MKVLIERTIKLVTEHNIKPEALKLWKDSKGAQTIDDYCNGDIEIIERKIEYVKLKVFDDKGVRISVEA